MTEIVERLRGWCIDWDNTPMDRGARPRDGLHCDCLLDAADEIETLRGLLSDAEATIKMMNARYEPGGSFYDASGYPPREITAAERRRR